MAITDSGWILARNHTIKYDAPLKKCPTVNSCARDGWLNEHIESPVTDPNLAVMKKYLLHRPVSCWLYYLTPIRCRACQYRIMSRL